MLATVLCSSVSFIDSVLINSFVYLLIWVLTASDWSQFYQLVQYNQAAIILYLMLHEFTMVALDLSILLIY